MDGKVAPSAERSARSDAASSASTRPPGNTCMLAAKAIVAGPTGEQHLRAIRRLAQHDHGRRRDRHGRFGRHDASELSRNAHSQLAASVLPVAVRIADEFEGQVEPLRRDVGRPRVEGHPGPTFIACAVQTCHGQGPADAEPLRARIDRQHANAGLAVPFQLGHRAVRLGYIGNAAKEPSIGSGCHEHRAGGRPSGDVAQLVTVVVAQIVAVAPRMPRA